MTSTVSPTTIAAVLGNPYDTISASVGLVVIALLVFALVAKQILRARDAPARVIGAYDVAIVPLSMAAGIVMVLRIVSLL
jgi:hypothetical protein